MCLFHAEAPPHTAATTTATAATTSTGGGTAAGLASVALGSAAGALGVGLGSAGELDGDLAVEDGLAVELGDGTLSLGRGREGNEGVADGARGAWVGWDGRGLAAPRVSLDELRDAEKQGPPRPGSP